MEPDDPVRSTARQVAEALVEGGTLIVVLVGRHARGDASPDSDLDIIVVGPEASSWRSERRDGFLVSVSAPVRETPRGVWGPRLDVLRSARLARGSRCARY